MMNIEIDFDVFKKLTQLRNSEEVTYNDVLRKLLGLGPQTKPVALDGEASAQKSWITKGVRFPDGTLFRAKYKGRVYSGKVESCALIVGDKRYLSTSSAAVAITGNSVNGWTFWECLIPGSTSWQMIKFLRR